MLTIDNFSEWDFYKNKLHFIDFDNYSQLIRESLWLGGESAYNRRRASQKTNDDFSGEVSFEAAHELAKKGWSKGIKKLASLKNKDDLVEGSIKENAVDLEYSTSGSYVDIGRYMSGHPQCMIIPRISHIPKRINIICSTGFNCSATQDDYYRYGKKVLEIIDFFENKNIRVQLNARWCVQRNGKFCVFNIMLKRYEEFLDLNKIAFCLCHRAYQRRLLFSIAERQPDEIIAAFGFHAGDGYSQTMELIVSEEEKKESLCVEPENVNQFDSAKKLLTYINKIGAVQ